MPASQMTSLRVPEDILAQLDQRVGFDGMRNRSDVIRAAIDHYLAATPTNADVRTIKLEIGTEARYQLAMLYELQGISAPEAARLGLDLYIRQTLTAQDTLTALLEARVEEMRARTRPNEDHTA